MENKMHDEIFLEKYNNLNPEQKQAVDTIDGPVMVVAGPGTGKTTILTLRIANILRQTDTPPSGILALTFTDAGVKAMRTKLREVMGSRADEVRIHTFHGFASSVIGEYGEHFTAIARASQLSDVLAETYIREILREKKFAKLRPLGDPDFYVDKIISGISECKKEAWGPKTVREFAEGEIKRIESDQTLVSTRGATKGQLKAEYQKQVERCQKTILFADIYEKYEERKIKERKIDFDDLLFQLLLALQTDELLLRILQEKFLYILVDEHQDTNDVQNGIVSLLANFFEEPNIFVVGDEKQAIYRFQGASVENFLRFQNTWKTMQVITLSSNYRSHQRILDATFALIEHNYEDGAHLDLRVELSSRSQHEPKPIEYVVAENTPAADSYLLESIQAILKSEPGSSVAVIVRRNRDVERLLALCQSRGVRACAEHGADIFSHPLGSLFWNILEYIVHPEETQIFAQTLSAGLWRVSLDTSVDLIKKIRSRTAEDAGQYLEEKIEVVKNLREELLRVAPVEYLFLVADASGLSQRMTEDPLSAEVWRGIIALASQIARELPEDARLLIEELLSYKIRAGRRSVKIGAGNEDCEVKIMTAHGSKGLEYDYVFLPHATEDSWMRRAQTPPFVFPRQKEEGDELRDSRRLFYVALTRARKHAVILSELHDVLGKEILPLRFIEELDKNHVVQKEIPARDVVSEPRDPTMAFAEIKSRRQKELAEYAKRVVTEDGISVTALNNFVACPSQFFYKSIMKLPEPASAMAEKGIAMHKAMTAVWKSKVKNVSVKEKEIENIINKTVKEHFSTSLLPLFEKEILIEELVGNSGKVAHELGEHFEIKGDAFPELWLESKFSEKILLRGQLDVLVETDTGVLVFDYKTKEGMSENEIRGKTKNSDGNYFRQLTFYKELVKGNSRYEGRDIELSLVFLKPDSKGRCPIITLEIGDEDTETVKIEIESLVESVWSGKLLTDTCSDPDCKWCPMKKSFLL